MYLFGFSQEFLSKIFKNKNKENKYFPRFKAWRKHRVNNNKVNNNKLYDIKYNLV